jgi:hypothetical protein
MTTWVPAPPLVGETALMLGGIGARGISTMTVVLPLTLPRLADTVAVPGAAGTTTAGPPEISKTVAIEVFEELHVTCDVTSRVLPSAYVPIAIAVSGCVEPMDIV